MKRLLCLLLAFLSGALAPVFASNPGRLVNISVRNYVGTGESVLIAGFVIVGEGTRPMMIRGVGPTLSLFQVPGVLSDPSLGLYNAQNKIIAENDNWGGADSLANAFSQIGAFGLPRNSLDSALNATLGAGSYTVITSGKAGGTGEALLEIYDGLPLATPGHALANLSLRGNVRPNGTFIAGFVIAGTQPKSVLLRAAGPELASFGLSNALPDPTLALYQGDQKVAANDNWSEAADPAGIAAAAKRFGAFPFAASSPDAGLLVTLLPGNYSLHVRGTDPSDTGTVLVEIYDTDFAPDAVTPPPAPPANGVPLVSITGPAEDPVEGSSASFTVSRTGPTDSALTVKLAYQGSAAAGKDYTLPPATVVIPAGASSASVTVNSLNDTDQESTESIEAVVIADSLYAALPGQNVGVMLLRDTPLSTTGWTAQFFNNTTFTGTPVLTRIDQTIDFDWGTAAPAAGVRADNFSVRWIGSLSVDTSQVYHFLAQADDRISVYVDDQPVIHRPYYGWEPISGGIFLEAGVRHKVVVDFADTWSEANIRLYWFTNGIVRQLVPAANVSPLTTTPPAAVFGPIETTAVAGFPFLLQLTSSGVTQGYTANGLPAGLALDATTGQVGGVLTSPGDYEFSITGVSAAGSGSTRVRLHVVAAEGKADVEYWQGPPPSGSLVPLQAAPTRIAAVGSLASPGDASGPFSRRIRGTITAPSTGLYSFWVKGGGRCEFWLADSNQPADRILRCASDQAPTWSKSPNQRSSAVLLKAGSRYYFELVQSGSAASDDTAAVGWLLPGAASAVPLEVVPGTVLSSWTPSVSLGASQKVVHVGTLRPPSTVSSLASGSVSVALDESSGTAAVTVQLSGLSSSVSAARLLLNPGVVNETRLLNLTSSLGSTTTWTLGGAGAYSKEQVIAALKAGEVYLRVETARFPAGELLAPLLSTLGASTFVPPAAPAPINTASITDAQAARFLTQATFGPTLVDIARLRQLGYDAWFDEQWSLPASTNIASIDTQRAAVKAKDPSSDIWQDGFDRSFWMNAVRGRDQLRQRVAFALSEIFVVSLDSAVNLDAGTVYYDNLIQGAGGTYRNLLETITKSPAMGIYLSMIKNQKTDLSKGIYPDENYAREIMQLFSIGLNKLHPDGTLLLDTQGVPVPTYTQEAIVGLAKVFTGWSFASNDPDYNYFWGDEDYRRPMQFYPAYHDNGQKRLIEGIVLPEGGNGEAELNAVMDMLANHPNTGPFLARQLIQRLVTSNPSPGYVYRVAGVFADNGRGVRGDLRAVVKAILMDPEARGPVDPEDPTRGKLREPILRVTQLWRAFGARAAYNTYDIAWFRSELGQEPMNSPTVFNFFQPTYVPNGPLARAGLQAPEFQITTESIVGNTANYLEWLTSPWGDDEPWKIVLDLSAALDARSRSNDELLDLLSLLLLQGQMSTDLRARLKTALTSYDSWVSPSDRIRYTIHTILCSPDYVVER